MTPVLPAFTGQVPRELAPSATAPRLWQGHETWVLDPDHPLFVTAGTAITRIQIAMFGTDHLYASDPFIEMLPTDADPDYPGRVAQAILAGLTKADDRATWVLQAWPFSDKKEYWTTTQVKTFLGAIDPGRLVILDLWAEVEPQWSRFSSFSGTEWLWCGLLNFGGRSDPMADLRGAVEAFRAARGAEHPPAGIGLAMEATRNNHVFYELLMDLAWYEIDDVDAWVMRFARERHGGGSPEIVDAWALLASTEYTAKGMRLHPDEFRGLLGRRPGPSVTQDRDRLKQDVHSLVWYRPDDLAEAWDLLTRAAEANPALASGPLGRDLIETAIAVLCRTADLLIGGRG
jgi:alpha-N-acetylglucosaminidase